MDGATIGVIAKRMYKRCGARRVSVCFLCVCERAAGSVGIFRAGRTQWKHLGEKGGKCVTEKRAAVGRGQVREVERGSTGQRSGSSDGATIGESGFANGAERVVCLCAPCVCELYV